MAALHEAEHLPCVPRHLQSLAVELAGEWVQRAHEVGDGLVAVRIGTGSRRVLGFGEHTGIGLGHHLFAVVDHQQVFLIDVVVEHVFRGLTEVDDPLTQMRRPHAVGHVLRVTGTGGVVVTADPADAASDEMGVAGIFALHENRVATEDR